MLKVLLAVQDENSRGYLSALCKEKGCKAGVIDTSSQIFQNIIDEEIDILFLDLDLPGLDVEYVLSEINEILRDLPVIVFARDPDLSTEIEVRMKRILYFAQKPLNPAEIKRVLQTAMDMVSSGKLETAGAPEESVFFRTKSKIKSKRKQWSSTVANASRSVIVGISTTDRKITNIARSFLPERLESDLKEINKSVKLPDIFLKNSLNRFLKGTKQKNRIHFRK